MNLISIQPKLVTKISYEEQLIKKFKANPKALYTYIKAKQKVKDTISHLVKEDGSIYIYIYIQLKTMKLLLQSLVSFSKQHLVKRL